MNQYKKKVAQISIKVLGIVDYIGLGMADITYLNEKRSKFLNLVTISNYIQKFYTVIRSQIFFYMDFLLFLRY